MKNIVFFLTFLANICFADIGSESFIKSFILSCEQQSKIGIFALAWQMKF